MSSGIHNENHEQSRISTWQVYNVIWPSDVRADIVLALSHCPSQDIKHRWHESHIFSTQRNFSSRNTGNE